MDDMDENFNFYQAVMAQHSETVPEPCDTSLDTLLNQIGDRVLADKIRMALKEQS